MSIRTEAPSITGEIQRYLATGSTDAYMSAWPGDLRQQADQSHRDLRGALIREVLRRSGTSSHAPLPAVDFLELTRRKVKPIVDGLFPKHEREAVLRLLERSVVFVSNENIASILLEERWHHTAWDIANLHLATLDLPLLGPSARTLVGLSQETTCYLSPGHFIDAEAGSDFLVHEVAHIFHNCKRRAAGLPETRTREWLLDIEFRKRETFAYACEFYSRIRERAADASERRRLAAEFDASRLTDERVDGSELANILQEAAKVRNGWKLILNSCAAARVRWRHEGRRRVDQARGDGVGRGRGSHAPLRRH